jgi:hypothetical protein
VASWKIKISHRKRILRIRNPRQAAVLALPPFLRAPRLVTGKITKLAWQNTVRRYGKARNLLVHIQEKQAKITQRPTYTRDLLPEDGDFGRFDDSAHAALITRLGTGQQVTEDDARRFSMDEERKTPASIDVVLHIDGSASMYGNYSQGGSQWECSPIQAGINTACIINEAAKKPRNHTNPKGQEGDIKVWTNIWGNDPPLLIAKPGDKPQDVGKAIAGLRNSQGWGNERGAGHCAYHQAVGGR